MKCSSHPVSVRLCLSAAAVLFTACVASVQSAEIFVGTEYIYPTTYDVTPIMGVNAAGQQVIVGAIVTPGGFQTRMVGVHMVVEATIANLNAVNGVIAVMADEKARGNTPLMIAASTGDEEGVKSLLARKSLVNAKNQFGSTAVMGAAAGGYTNIVQMLIAAGANVNAKSKAGSTALMFAAKNGHKDVVEILLARGATVNEKDNEGMTALMYGVYGGENEIVKLLVEKGAKPELSDHKGTTPIALASNQKKADIVATLSHASASR